ncbi:MAG TPA: hypothetical protein VJ767_06365 [Nitrososphaeraceae archaeon]|nr:hypothetical protein [Nitrososphaeraceae archaeon]
MTVEINNNLHYWLGSLCKINDIENNRKLYFPYNSVAISDNIKIIDDQGNSIPDKSWMLYLLELFNIQNHAIELNLICQFDNQSYFEAIFLGKNRYRFREIFPVIGHSYQRVILINKNNHRIDYILKDKTTDKIEIFYYDLKGIDFNYKMLNQFTGIEWWNKTGSFPYPIRYGVEISQIMFGYEDKQDNESITFVPHNSLIPNKDGFGREYPISFEEVKIRDGCISYTVKNGYCKKGIRYNC